MGVLDGIRVLDYGRFIAAPWCSALLADMGADVLRVEKREGGEDRWVQSVTDSGEGGTFLQCNRNKRSLTLDSTTAEGAEKLHATREKLAALEPAFRQAMSRNGLAGQHFDKLDRGRLRREVEGDEQRFGIQA